MAMWQFQKPNGSLLRWEEVPGEWVISWDDATGLAEGDEGFSTDLAQKKADSLEPDLILVYCGRGQEHEFAQQHRLDALAAEEAAETQKEADAKAAETEAQEKAAKARILQLLDPQAFAREEAAAAIEAEHAALVEFASPDEAEALEALKEQRIAALEPEPVE